MQHLYFISKGKYFRFPGEDFHNGTCELALECDSYLIYYKAAEQKQQLMPLKYRSLYLWGWKENNKSGNKQQRCSTAKILAVINKTIIIWQVIKKQKKAQKKGQMMQIWNLPENARNTQAQNIIELWY